MFREDLGIFYWKCVTSLYSDGPSHPLSCQIAGIGGSVLPGFVDLCGCSGAAG